MKTIYITITKSSLLFFVFFLVCHGIIAQTWVSRHGLTANQYQAEFNKWTQQGLRPIQVSGYTDSKNTLYAVIFQKVTNGPAWKAIHGVKSANYQNTFNNFVQQGFKPVQVSGYAVGNDVHYAAIFEKIPAGLLWQARHGLSSAAFQAEFNKWNQQGYRLTDLCGYSLENQDYYAAIWEKISGPAWVARHGMTADVYQSEFNKYLAQGYRLKQVSCYYFKGKTHFAALWEKAGKGLLWSRTGLSHREYQDEFDRMYYQGYRPTWVAGYNHDGDDRYAGIWECENGFVSSEISKVDDLVKKFMQDYNVPGVSLAITKDGRLVLAKTYGYANKDKKELVAPRHLFRIASVAKPITSVAIMKLVEEKKLKLSDKVFGTNGILGTQYGKTPYGKNIGQITVQHLLEHTSGGWNNKKDDPMFSHGSMNHAELISWVLDNRALDNEPGKVSAYSNFGYCVLGRIIEKKSGQSYANYVKSKILNPCGISGMDIGGDQEDDRKANEVVYYGQDGQNPYSMKVARMDSHGGWIATPIDLVRFMVRVDRFSNKPDILASDSLTTMFTPCSVAPGYAKGWAVNQTPNYWHNGSLPGTQAFLVRTNSGFCWAILVNTRNTQDKFGGDMDQLMWNIIGAIKQWPSWDLF